MSILTPPGWNILDRQPAAYSRLLEGSELLYDQYEGFYDGLAQWVIGVPFKAPGFDAQELEARTRYALGKLRFTYPIIAAPLERGVHHKELRSWVYTPVSSRADIDRWFADAVVVEKVSSAINVNDFILETNRNVKLPHVTKSGTNVHWRCYLQVGNGEYALYFHGPHSIMDGWPTLGVLKQTFEWIVGDQSEQLERLAWGTEYQNLPAGPLIVTGGIKPEWATPSGQALGAKIQSLYGAPKPPHGLIPQRPIPSEGTASAIRYILKVDGALSQQLFAEAKKLGFSASHLFEAAQILALLETNPLPEGDPEAHITNEQTFVALESRLEPQYKTKPHWISAHVWIPLHLTAKELALTGTRREKLVTLLGLIKAQMQEYTDHPCTGQWLALGMLQKPPTEKAVPRNPYATTITNLADVQRRLPLTYGQSADGKLLIELLDMQFGHRWTGANPNIHCWTWKSQIHIQIQAEDNWDQNYIEAYAASIVDAAKAILS